MYTIDLKKCHFICKLVHFCVIVVAYNNRLRHSQCYNCQQEENSVSIHNTCSTSIMYTDTVLFLLTVYIIHMQDLYTLYIVSIVRLSLYIVSILCLFVVIDMSQETGVTPEDLISTLQYFSLLKYWKGKHIIIKKKVSRRHMHQQYVHYTHYCDCAV